jgi:hypothetical protein
VRESGRGKKEIKQERVFFFLVCCRRAGSGSLIRIRVFFAF